MKYEIDRLQELLSRHLFSCKPFSLVRFLGEKDVYEDIDLKILPYNSGWSDGFFFSSEEPNTEIFYPSTKKVDYLRSIKELIEELKINNNKVVISTVIDGTLNEEQKSNLVQNIVELFNVNRDCFATVFNSTHAGLWIVMTPELLLKESDGILSTMALAGTRPAGTVGPWDTKNQIEQQFVTNYIKNCWETVGHTVEIEEPHTLQSGPVEHICTRLWTKSANPDDYENLMAVMNPTPAVCGFPKDYALDKINSIETHRRQLYSGLLCVQRESGDKIAYVTLRCVHLSPEGRYNIFVGGGITADSSPEAEWEETRLKASQLIECLTHVTRPLNG